MSGKIVLYGINISPPVRACLLTLEALNISFKFKVVDIFKNEQLNKEFIKHNPQHTVPVLDDNGTWICDSHAICGYLVDKYGKLDALYPKDLAKRAVVNHRLYFDASILFMSLRNITRRFFRKHIKEVPADKTENVLEGLNFVESFLSEHPYIAGDEMTIADFCCVATVSSLRGMINCDSAKYPKTTAWINRLSQLPFYEEANGKGLREYMNMLKPNLVFIQYKVDADF